MASKINYDSNDVINGLSGIGEVRETDGYDITVYNGEIQTIISTFGKVNTAVASLVSNVNEVTCGDGTTPAPIPSLSSLETYLFNGSTSYDSWKEGMSDQRTDFLAKLYNEINTALNDRMMMMDNEYLDEIIIGTGSSDIVKGSGVKIKSSGELGTSIASIPTEYVIKTYADGKMSKLSAAANNKIILGGTTATAAKSSGKEIGGATLASTPNANTVATEAAVKAYADSKIAGLSEAAANKIILGGSTSTTVNSSGVTIRAAGNMGTSSTTVPTESVIASYVDSHSSGGDVTAAGNNLFTGTNEFANAATFTNKINMYSGICNSGKYDHIKEVSMSNIGTLNEGDIIAIKFNDDLNIIDDENIYLRINGDDYIITINGVDGLSSNYSIAGHTIVYSGDIALMQCTKVYNQTDMVKIINPGTMPYAIESYKVTDGIYGHENNTFTENNEFTNSVSFTNKINMYSGWCNTRTSNRTKEVGGLSIDSLAENDIIAIKFINDITILGEQELLLKINNNNYTLTTNGIDPLTTNNYTSGSYVIARQHTAFIQCVYPASSGMNGTVRILNPNVLIDSQSGGSGGDVTAAGNNTFTGENTFNDITYFNNEIELRVYIRNIEFNFPAYTTTTVTNVIESIETNIGKLYVHDVDYNPSNGNPQYLLSNGVGLTTDHKLSSSLYITSNPNAAGSGYFILGEISYNAGSHGDIEFSYSERTNELGGINITNLLKNISHRLLYNDNTFTGENTFTKSIIFKGIEGETANYIKFIFDYLDTETDPFNPEIKTKEYSATKLRNILATISAGHGEHDLENSIESAERSIIIGGHDNTIDSAEYSVILNSSNCNMEGGFSSTSFNTIISSCNSEIARTYDNNIILGGTYNKVYGSNMASVGGNHNTIYGSNSVTIGGMYNTVGAQLNNTQLNAIALGGKYNNNSSGDIVTVGGGTGDSSRANLFRIDSVGKTYGNGAWNTSGADYAEYFEWLDSNPNSDDRVGLFVTLDGENIRFATTSDDYVLGIVSGAPTVVGDAPEDVWHSMWLKDIYGRIQYHTIHHEAEYREVEETDPETGETTKKNIVVRDEYDEVEPIINPDYDPSKEYVPRSERAEWATVGMVGKLVVIDDGTCEVNGYATVSDKGDGTATAATSDSLVKYRVLARLDETHVKVLFR